MTPLFSPPGDLGLSAFAGVCGVGVVLLLALVIGLEAILFRVLMPGSKALRDSALVNLASTVLGIPLLGVWANAPAGQAGNWSYLVLLATWGLSVAIEALLLRLLEKGIGWRRIVATSMAANAVSYLLLVAALFTTLLLGSPGV